MYANIFGKRINLVYVTIIVATYDLVHILIYLKTIFERFASHEGSDLGCLGDIFHWYCIAIYNDSIFHVIDLMFTAVLIYGANRVRFAAKLSGESEEISYFHF